MLSVRDWVASKFERRNAGNGYTDTLLAIIQQQASGKQTADSNSGGALELCAGVVGRAFASARVETPRTAVRAALSPLTLSSIGRALIRAGEAIYAIDTNDGISLLPASAWDISGGVLPSSWEYRLDLGTPNGTIVRRLGYDGVVHIRYAYNPERAWEGLSPLEIATQAGSLDAKINQALADESGMPHGGILPMPVQPDDQTTDEVEATLKSLNGKIMLAESMSASGEGYLDTPKGDWMVNRVGASFSQPLVDLRRDADELVLGLCGVPIEFLKSADGSALREAYRRMLFGTIQPLGAIVAHELSSKLETQITLVWDELRAADRASGARAYKALREAGMAEQQALRLSGL